MGADNDALQRATAGERNRALRAMSDADLSAVTEEESRRATALGQQGRASRLQQAADKEQARRGGPGNGRAR